MKINIAIALACLISFACGSDIQDSVDEGSDLGQTEEQILVGNGGYGFATNTTQLRCAQPGGSGQTCFSNAGVSKFATYCFIGFSNSDRINVSFGVEAVDTQTNWTFTETNSGCDITIAAGNFTPSTTPNIENYVRIQPTGSFFNQTSPAGSSHINGTWTGFTKLLVTVDTAKIHSAFGTSLQVNALEHAGGHIAAKFIGLGTQQDTSAAAVASPTRRGMGLNPPPTTLAPGEVCRANNFTTGNSSQISAAFGCAAF